jgi:hypothetical protein
VLENAGLLSFCPFTSKWCEALEIFLVDHGGKGVVR